MPILPVLDVMHGQVVRGVAGRRQEYRPIASCLTQSSVPLDVARALCDRFGFREFYLADLDAIQGSPPASQVYERLRSEGFQLWIDAGVRNAGNAVAVGNWTNNVVAGLETLKGPGALAQIGRELGTRSVVFSLDLKDGQPLGDCNAWGAATAWAIAGRAIDAGVARILVLDLAHVGTGSGTPTADLCVRLREAYPHLEIATGGGIRGPDDVREVYACGASYVLVASALHDGRITPADAAALDRGL
jgi:phosphoribosylformimino-5-aminoimidazole carboxamide ribotide isomerase